MSDGSRRRGVLARWILDPLLTGAIGIQAAFVDARFVRRQGLHPGAAGRVLAYPSLAWDSLRRRSSRARQEALFARYYRLNRLHYGPTGRGYQGVAPGGPDERRRRYEEQTSRLEYFVDAFPDLLGFRDGDSFLDLGCGTGQNLRMLAARFPNSRIAGYDLNADAVALVQEFEPHPGVTVAVGDLIDREMRRTALSEPIDHVIMSHVFSLVLGPSREATIELRRAIIDDVVDGCRKGVVIVDSFGMPGPPTITIEQRQRATVTDDVMGYFAGRIDGRALMAQSDRTRAVIFSKAQGSQSGGLR